MQPDQGNLTYTKVVNLLEYCNNNTINVRGHTVFWDDVGTLQPWLTSINDPVQLFSTMVARVNQVVTPFKVRFQVIPVDLSRSPGAEI